MHILLTDPAVPVVRPVSVISQAKASLQAVGGSVALISSVFALVFVRKQKFTFGEVRAQELTLRGFANVDADVEEYKAMEEDCRPTR